MRYVLLALKHSNRKKLGASVIVFWLVLMSSAVTAQKTPQGLSYINNPIALGFSNKFDEQRLENNWCGDLATTTEALKDKYDMARQGCCGPQCLKVSMAQAFNIQSTNNGGRPISDFWPQDYIAKALELEKNLFAKQEQLSACLIQAKERIQMRKDRLAKNKVSLDELKHIPQHLRLDDEENYVQQEENKQEEIRRQKTVQAFIDKGYPALDASKICKKQIENYQSCVSSSSKEKQLPEYLAIHKTLMDDCLNFVRLQSLKKPISADMQGNLYPPLEQNMEKDEDYKKAVTQSHMTDPAFLRLAWSSLICIATDRRQSSHREITMQNHYSRIGGATNYRVLYGLQGSIRKADEVLKESKKAFRQLKSSPISCKLSVIQDIINCDKGRNGLDEESEECQYEPMSKLLDIISNLVEATH